MILFQKTREQMEESVRNFDRRREEDDRQFNLKLDRMVEEDARRREEADRRWEEVDRKFQETALQSTKTDRKIAYLGSRVGDIIQSMVAGNIVEKFQALGYNNLDDFCEKKKFRNKKLGIKGEVDLFLENGNVAILIEVKTTLETKDVQDHIERLEKYRRYADARGVGDQRRFIGAIAGAVVMGDAVEFARENGLYVIVQSGDAVEILQQPEGFVAKEW